MNFYSKYRALCADRGESPTAAGTKMGFSRATVNRWKNGSEPSDKNKIIIASYFEIPTLDLYDDEAKEKAPSEDEADSPMRAKVLAQIREMDEEQLFKLSLLIKMAKEI